MGTRKYVLFLVITSSSFALAQGKGELKLYVSPFNGMEYVLDGKERSVAKGLVLPEGEHRFVFWAPDRQMLDTTLMIQADSVHLFYKTLEPTLEYRTYKDAQKRVLLHRFWYRVGPAALASASIAWVVSSKKELDAANETLLSLPPMYADLRDPTAFSSLKYTSIPNAEADVDQAQKLLTTSIVVASIATATTVWGFIKAASLKDPVYEDKGKVIFDGLVWVPGSGFNASLTFPIR